MSEPGTFAPGRLGLEMGFGALGIFVAMGAGSFIHNDNQAISKIEERIAPMEQTIHGLEPQAARLSDETAHATYPQYFDLKSQVNRAKENIDALDSNKDGYIPFAIGGLTVAGAAGLSFGKHTARVRRDKQFQRNRDNGRPHAI